VEKLDQVERDRVSTSAGDSEEILGFGVDQVVHLTPPVNRLNALLALVAPNPAPVDGNGKGGNNVVDNLEIVEAGLGDRDTGGLGRFSKSCFSIKSNGEGARRNLVVRN
jgi:hypothetical protein